MALFLFLFPILPTALLSSFASAQAQTLPSDGLDPIVVTANRLETPQSEVASSTTVIGPAEIERKGKEQVYDLLRDVPGLAVVNQGGSGQTTSIFIRGADSDQVLVLIDGVEANDPLSPARAFDFGNLSAEDIERIEIIRGSQSVLYGSEAIGGVINIITKKGHQGPPQAHFEAEYGNYETYRLGASVRGGTTIGEEKKNFNYALGASQQGTQGFPAADQALGNVVDAGQSMTTVTGNADLQLEPATKVLALLRYSNATFGLPITGGPPGFDAFGEKTGDDPGSQGTDRQLYGKLEAIRKMSEVWQADFALHYSGDRRTSFYQQVTTTTFGGYDEYDSQRLRGVFQNNLFLSDADTLTLGLELASESGKPTEILSQAEPDIGIKDRSDRLESGFVQNQWLGDSLFATAGLRYDTYQNIGSDTTYRIAPGWKFKETGTTLRSSLGSGFKIPSLYQRYSNYGDPSLQPERSVSYDFGVDQAIGPASIGLTYFRTDTRQLIESNPVTYVSENIGQATSQGAEAEARARFDGPLTGKGEGRLVYTYTWARDDESGLPLLRRPKHQLSAELTSQPTERLDWTVEARFVGARDDIDPVTANRVLMGAYAVYSVSARCRILHGLNAFGRLDNLLDRVYEEVDGYGTARRSLYLGLSEEI